MAKRPGASSTTQSKYTADLEALSFGQALNTIRSERELSQTALANRLDRSTSFVSLLETGHRRPNRELIERLSQALELPPDSPDRNALLRAAGYEVGEISGTIRRLVDTVGAKHQLGEAERFSLHADISALVSGWEHYFRIVKQFDQGLFTQVASSCEQLLEQKHLSPTLHTNVRMILADTKTHQGELNAAETIAREAATSTESGEVAPALAPTMSADISALRGLIAVDKGRYIEGKKLLETSIGQYQRLLVTQKATEKPDIPFSSDIAYIGIGSSYKRLAEITLLQGEPVNAFTYCLAAESYLNQAAPSEERDRWLRRTTEQKAWAYTKLGDFDRAIELRENTREALERAHDEYGLARNSLYTGNDYLSLVKEEIRKEIAQEPTSVSPQVALDRRAKAIRSVLHRKRISDALTHAKERYEEAKQQLETYDQQRLLGLCLSNLATTLRYIAFRDNDQTVAEDARKMLAQALTLEQSIGHHRRIATIYEFLGDLEVDQAHFQSAQYYYRKGIEQLDSYLGTAKDAAAATQRERLRISAEEVEGLLRSRNGYVGSLPFEVLSPDERWSALCNDLAQLAKRVIETSELQPVAYSSRADNWGVIIHEVEKLPGGRRMLQNGLSDALTPKVRAGVSLKGAELHGERFEYFEYAIRKATAPGDRNQDLCSRNYVERELRQEGTAELTREQIDQALKWMEQYPTGYWLDSSDADVPLAFFLKGSRILFEIPAQLAPSFPGSRGVAQHVGASMCYDITNEEGANELRALFDKFVNTANDLRSGRPNSETTIEWLRRLQGTGMPAPGLVPVAV